MGWRSTKNVSFYFIIFIVLLKNQKFHLRLVPSCILIKEVVGILSPWMAFQSAWSVIVVLAMAWLPTICPQTLLISYLLWSQMERSDPRWNSFCFGVSFSLSDSSAFSIGRQLWGTVLSLSGGNWFEPHSSAFPPLFFVRRHAHRRARALANTRTLTHKHAHTKPRAVDYLGRTAAGEHAQEGRRGDRVQRLMNRVCAHKINGMLLLSYPQDSHAHKRVCLHSTLYKHRAPDSPGKSIMCHLRPYTNPLTHDES